LIERAATEAELAGVIAHELAHVSARHGARLMKRANIANIMYQMAQIAVLIGTGGVATIGAYYLFQAGFLGLGLVLDLNLLGVSREFESEADQLGIQYAWKAGYDPRGFITFFDKMAAEKGYIQSASFFRTHPPYFERIVSTLTEIAYLPARGDLPVDSSGFQGFKKRLTDTLRKEEKDDKDAPKLRPGPKCEDEDKSRTGECAGLPGSSPRWRRGCRRDAQRNGKSRFRCSQGAVRGPDRTGRHKSD
jgi:predicted Zn-dependent protease